MASEVSDVAVGEKSVGEEEAEKTKGTDPFVAPTSPAARRAVRQHHHRSVHPRNQSCQNEDSVSPSFPLKERGMKRQILHLDNTTCAYT